MDYTQKFISRLKKELSLNIPDDAYAISTHAGKWQRAKGACTSMIKSNTTTFVVCLFTPIKFLVKCPNLKIDIQCNEVCVDCGCQGGICKSSYSS